MAISPYKLDQHSNLNNRDFDDDEIEYPYSDGEPVAESDFQLVWLVYFVSALKAYFANSKDMYAAGNMFVYFEKGNPKAVVAPDIFVVTGVENKLRYSFKVWEEGGKTPDFVIEILSRSTVGIDKTSKMDTYAHLGVKEYILFDPTDLHIDPSFEIYHLGDNGYQQVSASHLQDGYHVFHSDVLGLELHIQSGDFRFYNPKKGEYIVPLAEEQAARQVAQAEKKRANAEKEKANAEKERANAEKERANAEKKVAETAQAKEKAARIEAEKRIADLEAEIERLKKSGLI